MEQKCSHDGKPCCGNQTSNRMVVVAVVITLTFLIGYGFGKVTERFNRESRSVCPMVKLNKQLKNGNKQNIPVKNDNKQVTATSTKTSTKK